ncbi:hypothetical protein [Undibacterium sp. Di24W]|uniref:hypothetical protein n=1 Tax=Undibacterium sp. Di24W TaxID=3413033 RepID=UPI003BF4266E
MAILNVDNETINLASVPGAADLLVDHSMFAAIDAPANAVSAGVEVLHAGATVNTLNHSIDSGVEKLETIQTPATIVSSSSNITAQAYLHTLVAGTAAGVYAFQNIDGTLTAVDSTDFIVMVTGTGAIVASDFVM